MHNVSCILHIYFFVAAIYTVVSCDPWWNPAAEEQGRPHGLIAIVQHHANIPHICRRSIAFIASAKRSL